MKMYNTNRVRDFRELLEICRRRWISQTERFRNENTLDVSQHIRVWEHIFFDEACQI